MQEDKTKKWYFNQNWMNCIMGILLLGFMVFTLIFAGEKLSDVKPGFYVAVIAGLILFLALAMVKIYYLEKKVTSLKIGKRPAEQFRKVVIEAINLADADKLFGLLDIGYALSYCVERDKPSAFSEIVKMFNKERIGVDFSLLWFEAAELGHVEIMKKIQELELCDKDVQLAGHVTAAHVALDQQHPKMGVIRYLVNIGADLTVRRVSDQKTPYELVPSLYREACKLLPETKPVSKGAPEEKPEDTEETKSEASEKIEPEEKPEETEPEAGKAETEQVESAVSTETDMSDSGETSPDEADDNKLVD